MPYVLETVRLLAGELDVPHRLRRGAVHPGQLPDRGRPVARPTRRTKAAHARRPAFWAALLDRLADIVIASLRAQVQAGAAAVQVFDCWAGACSPGRLPPLRPARHPEVFAGLADLGVPRIHFGVGTGELLELLAEAGADVVGVDWRVPLDRARARAGRPRRRAGQPRPGRLPGARGTSWPGRPPPCSSANGGRPGHVFNLGHGVHARDRPGHPAPAGGSRPRCLSADEQPHRGPAHGLRHPGHARTTSRPTTPTSAGAGPRPPAQLDELRGRYEAIGGTSPLLERTEEQRAGVAAALGDGYRVELGMKHAPPFLEDAVVALAAAGVRRIVGRRPGPPLLGPVGRRVRHPGGCGGRTGPASSCAWSTPGTWRPATSTCWPASSATPWPASAWSRWRWSSPPTAFRSGSWPWATPTRTSWPRPPQPWPPGPASPGGRSGGRARGARPSRGSGPDLLSVLPMLVAAGAAGAVVCACGFVSDHLEVLYDLDVEAAAEAAGSGWPSPARRRPTPIRRSAPPWPRWCDGDAEAPTSAMPEPRRVAVVGGGITGLATALVPQQAGVDVTLIEADDRLGGKIRTDELAGVPVEAGPDTFLARVPAAVDLCRALGLGDELVAPATGTAFIWAGGRLRPLPEGHVLGVPTALGPLVRSGVLTPAGVARAALDLVLPRPVRPRPVRGRGGRPAHGPGGGGPAGRAPRRGHQRRRWPSGSACGPPPARSATAAARGPQPGPRPAPTTGGGAGGWRHGRAGVPERGRRARAAGRAARRRPGPDGRRPPRHRRDRRRAHRRRQGGGWCAVPAPTSRSTAASSPRRRRPPPGSCDRWPQTPPPTSTACATRRWPW